VELRQLRYFVAVAEELSFTRAAQRLHISQPPLSRQVSSLEAALGVQLLQRNKQRVILTDAGHVFLARARGVLAELEAAAGMARRASQGEIGRLRIGIGGSAALSVMPAVLRAFRLRYPSVELTLEQLAMSERLESLRNGRIDLGFVLLPFGERSLAVERMIRDPLLLAVPADHPLAKKRRVRLKEAEACDFVAFPRTGSLGYHRRIVDTCRHAGFMPRIVRETAPMESVIGLVASGIGIAIVPSMARRLRLDNVAYLPILDKGGHIDFAFAWNKGNTSAVLQAFLTTARDVVRRRDAQSDI